MSFAVALKTGLLGEDKISRWLIARGYNVLPAYQIENDASKGPRLFTADGKLVAPDLLVFRPGKTLWVEVKTKGAFTFHRKSDQWQTGIDRYPWQQYLKVAARTEFPVWIMFLHISRELAKDTPPGRVPPRGLFGNEITQLATSIDHEFAGYGQSGMVYWNANSLKRIAPPEEFDTFEHDHA